MLVRRSSDERYRGKPLLLFLENYVLWSIELIEDDELEFMRSIEPKLSETFGGDGTWQDAIRRSIALNEGSSVLIGEAWERVVRHLEEYREKADPLKFAQAFIDAHVPQ